jgi:RNA polymerase sigma factor (sigma-70 family)
MLEASINPAAEEERRECENAMLPLRDTIRIGPHRRLKITGVGAIRPNRPAGRSAALDINNFEVTTLESTERDRLLLDALRQGGDPDAFESLVEVHRDSVFDLSRRILMDDSLAEDVVQESFLTLYGKATTLPADVNVRAWLLGVARRHALERQRKISRLKKREATYAMNRADGEQKGSAVVEPEELRHALDSLPEELQLPLALHYLHGLPRVEVAAVLKTPNRTISFRIARGLERLRAILEAKEGRTASASLGILTLESGLKVLPLAKAPGVTAAKILQGLNAAKIASASARPAVRLGSSAPRYAVAAGVLIVLVSGAAWWTFGSASRPRATGVPSAAPVQSSAPVSPAEAKRDSNGLFARWTFEKDLPRDIQVLQGDWHWQAGADGHPGVAAIPAAQDTILLLPTKIPKQPFVVTMSWRHAYSEDNEPISWGVDWLAPGPAGSGAIREYNRFEKDTAWYSGVPSKVEAYFVDDYLFQVSNENLISVFRFPRSYPYEQIVVLAKTMEISSIELRGLRPDEVPAEYRDPRRLLEKLKK